MQCEFNAPDARISISGEFTFTDYVDFREIADRLFKLQSNSIVIDVSKLEFIDSAGLGMLLIARDEALKTNHTLVLRGAKGQVKRIFAATKFDTLFTVEG